MVYLEKELSPREQLIHQILKVSHDVMPDLSTYLIELVPQDSQVDPESLATHAMRDLPQHLQMNSFQGVADSSFIQMLPQLFLG